jgi:hypothetical protein
VYLYIDHFVKVNFWQLTKKSIFQWFPHFLLGGVCESFASGPVRDHHARPERQREIRDHPPYDDFATFKGSF